MINHNLGWCNFKFGCEVCHVLPLLSQFIIKFPERKCSKFCFVTFTWIICGGLTRQNKLAKLFVVLAYHQVSNIRRTLLGNKFVDHSDVVGASPSRRCSNYIFILDLTPGFIGLGKDNFKTRRGTFKFGWFGAAYIRDFTTHMFEYELVDWVFFGSSNGLPPVWHQTISWIDAA